MRRNDLFSAITFVATLAFTLVAVKFLAPRWMGREATVAELGVIALCLCAFALWRRARAGRRERQRLDQIRDSALW